MVSIYKEENDESFQSLLQAVEVKDYDNIRHLAHKMNGSALIIQSQKFSDICFDIEKQAQLNSLDPSDIEKFKSTYLKLTNHLSELLKNELFRD